jgi:hypothetical protein
MRKPAIIIRIFNDLIEGIRIAPFVLMPRSLGFAIYRWMLVILKATQLVRLGDCGGAE